MAFALAVSMLSGVKSGIKAHPKAGGGSGVFSRSRNFDVTLNQNSRNFCIGEVVVFVHANQQGIPGDSFGSGPPESDLPVPEAALLVADQNMVRSDIDALDHVASDALVKGVKLVFNLDFLDLPVDRIDENCSHKNLSVFRSEPHAPFVWHTMP